MYNNSIGIWVLNIFSSIIDFIFAKKNIRNSHLDFFDKRKETSIVAGDTRESVPRC